MAGYGIEDVPHTALSDEEQTQLAGHDEQQAALMAESLIAVDEWDNVLGPISKVEAHRGPGQFHRAFSLLVFDSQQRLLLQKRSEDKVTFPGVWANTCCSHPP